MPKRKKTYITRKHFTATMMRAQSKETLVRLIVELAKKFDVQHKQLAGQRILIWQLRDNHAKLKKKNTTLRQQLKEWEG